MEQPPADALHRSLRWWHGLVLFAIALAAQVVIGLIYAVVALFAMPAGSDPADQLALLLSAPSIGVQVLLTSAVLSALALLPARLITGGTTAALRLVRPAHASSAALAAAGVLPAGLLIDEVAYLLHRAWPGFFDTGTLDAFSGVFADSAPGAFVLVTLAVSLGPALGEELFFRGLVLRAFGRSLPAWSAIGLSAVLFGALHLDPLQGTGAVLVGVYLGYIVLATGSLWPAVLAHGLNNLGCSLAARFDPEGIGRTYDHGHPPALLVAAVVVLALAILGVERARRRFANAPPAA
jgi:membrane protease YdiL (CAAX protease family)